MVSGFLHHVFGEGSHSFLGKQKKISCEIYYHTIEINKIILKNTLKFTSRISNGLIQLSSKKKATLSYETLFLKSKKNSYFLASFNISSLVLSCSTQDYRRNVKRG